MKRFPAILLLLVLAFHQTELHQILKLPILVEHYYEHREWDKDITLFEFLKEHYLHDKIDADYQRDMQLPFKSDHCMLASSPLVVPEGVSFRNPIPETVDFTFPKIERNLKPSGFLEDIFRPPKTA